MKSGDERKKRIGELRELKKAQFVLRDKLDFAEIDIEDWSDTMTAFNIDVEKSTNLARLRRLAVVAAYKNGWYSAAPEELADDDFKLMPPALVASLGNDVLVLFNDVVSPDESFT